MSESRDTIELPSPRYILIHAHGAQLDANDIDPTAHAFGPFDTWDAMVAFDRSGPADSCYRFAVPLIGPDPGDMAMIALGLMLGARPMARQLPERERKTAAGHFAEVALAELRRIQKEERRKAKRKTAGEQAKGAPEA